MSCGRLLMSVALPPPGTHGGDGPKLAHSLDLDLSEILDLSQSLNPFAPDVGSIVRRQLHTVGWYPDPTAATSSLAEAIGVDPGRLLLTNGGSEAISLVTHHLGGSVRSEPEFALHPRDETGPTWRSDPHNPSGKLAAEDEAADVWDEAFYPLATGEWTAHRPGVTVGSLTKVFACPGLRLGYVVADEVGALSQLQPHWSVSSLALAALPEMLELADLGAWAKSVSEARVELVSVLNQHGFIADAQDAPWVLVKAPGLREQLAPHGVIVRDCTSFDMPGTVRIAVPGPEGLERLVAALEKRCD